MLLKKTKSKLWAAWISAAFGVLALLLAAEVASAAPCDIKPATPAIIRHDLGASYCELCGYGYITIVISNPYEGADMTSMTVVEDLSSSGLTFDSTAPTPMTYRVNGGPLQVGGDPGLSPTNNSILTWTSFQIAELGSLVYDPDPFDVSTITIIFAVTRDSGLSQEGLHAAIRDMQAEVTYTAQYLDDPPPPGDPIVVQCPGMPATVNTGVNPLQYREPDPAVAKGGRNVDAAQGSYTPTVYGNDNDDVIWRIRVTNSGNADLQGLRLDDVMETDNIDIRFICPTEAAAEEIAITNNGAGPSTMGCDAVAGNSVLDYDVDNPFGNPGGDPSDTVDVLQSGNADIFLVGKILVSSLPDIGACSIPKTNTANDVEWGCEGDPPPFLPASPAGGIDSTSTGSPLADVTATLSTRSDTDLDISVDHHHHQQQRRYGAQPRVDQFAS